MLTALKRGTPNWKIIDKPHPDAWIEQFTFDEILDLDPASGAKLTAAKGNTSARYKGPAHNYAKDIAADVEIPPITAKVRYDNDTGTMQVEDLDGLRRAVAAHNMFGSQKRMPVVFVPADDYTAKLSRNPDRRKDIAANIDMAMEDDMNFPGVRENARNELSW